jgi:hypothetical protein
MILIDFMKTNTGRNIVSVILALGLACMLRITCKEANMVIIKGPPIESVENKIFSFDSKCYSYKTVASSCKNMEDNKIE